MFYPHDIPMISRSNPDVSWCQGTTSSKWSLRCTSAAPGGEIMCPTGRNRATKDQRSNTSKKGEVASVLVMVDLFYQFEVDYPMVDYQVPYLQVVR